MYRVKDDGRSELIGYFALRDGQVVTDPPDHPTLANLREVNVITMVKGQLRKFTPDDHPREWLRYLNHELRNYIYAGTLEWEPDDFG